MIERTWLRGPSRMASIIHDFPDAVVVVDASATILWVNAAAEALIGHRAEELVGRNGLDLVDPRDVETVATALLRTLDSPGAKQPWQLRVVRGDGTSAWVEMAPSNLLGDPGIAAVVVSVRSLGGRVAAEAEARSIEELFRRAFDDAPIGMALVSADGLLARVNRAICTLLQRQPFELVGLDVQTLTHPEDVEREAPLIDELLAGTRSSYDLDKRLLLPDGSAVWAGVGVSLVRSADGEPERFVVHVQDVTDRKATEAFLAHRATHDPLTSLPNRALFDDRLDVALARSERLPTGVGVLFCDLVGFKAVNDELGHDTGDAVLRQVAARLQDAVRPGDTVARFGGDEFVVLCEDLVSDRDLDAIAFRMARAVSRPIQAEGREVTLGLSIGKALSSGTESAADLLKMADAAMYAARAEADR